MAIDESTVVTTPRGTGTVIKRVGMRVRVQYEGDQTGWCDLKDVQESDAAVPVATHQSTSSAPTVSPATSSSTGNGDMPTPSENAATEPAAAPAVAPAAAEIVPVAEEPAAATTVAAPAVTEPEEEDVDPTTTLHTRLNEAGDAWEMSSPTIFDEYAVTDYEQELGGGGFGKVYKGVHNASGVLYAIKTMNPNLEAATRKKESLIPAALRHENIVRVRAWSKGDGRGESDEERAIRGPANFVVVLEMLSCGDLYDRLTDGGAPMSEPAVRGYMTQLLKGVAYMHSVGVAHLDLKLENVMLDGNGTVKIIDFGISHVYPRRADDGSVDTSARLTASKGTPCYQAPENIAAAAAGTPFTSTGTAVVGGNGRDYDGFPSDMWSLGVMLFAMIKGFFPWELAVRGNRAFKHMERSVNEAARPISATRVVLAHYRKPADIDGWSEEATEHVIDLIDQLLLLDPTRRITAEQALHHPFIEGPPRFRGGFSQQAQAQEEEEEVEDEDDGAIRVRSVFDPSDYEDDGIAEPPTIPPLCRRDNPNAQYVDVM